MTAPVYNPPVPYVGYIDGGIYPGRLIRIQGSTPPVASRFSVNLQCGPNTNPRDDIALHISALFNEVAVTRNSLVNQIWGPDERHGHFPFMQGQSFELILLCDPTSYKIAINGQHYTEFTHRMPYQRVTHLTIDGDVLLTLIQFEGSSSVPGMAGTAATMGLAAGAGYAAGATTVPPYPTLPAGGIPPYPTLPAGGIPPYPAAPGYPVQAGYPAHGQQQPYPGYNPHSPYPTSPSSPYHQNSGGSILDKAGAALAGALGGAGVASILGGGHKKKGHHSMLPGGAVGSALGAGALGAAIHGKKHKKAQNKALKYGIPIAGLGLGAYGISKVAKHGFHGSSSSSSSSSSEEE